MTELFIKEQEDRRDIALVENGKIIEYYEEDNGKSRKEGNIYIGIVKDIVKGMQSAFIDIGIDKNSFIHLKDILPKVDEKKEKIKDDVQISDVVKKGQKLVVQIKKDSNENKGARVSTHINLPGKYIALMPNTDIITVSQKIEDKEEQKRLISLVKKHLNEGNGAIIRTSAEGKEQEIIDDIKKIEKKWDNIIETNVNPNQNVPQILYKSENIVERLLIDLTGKGIEKIVVSSKKIMNEIKRFISENEEYQRIKLELQDKEQIFKTYEIDNQIEKIQNRKIWLKCGGFITIDKTEALTAIDVNTGKFTGTNSLEQTVFRVNKEATVEIAKQLKLRDIGGIIIIDYIDMNNEKSKREIVELLKNELKKDRSKTQVEGFTKLDLMEMTRKHICSHKD